MGTGGRRRGRGHRHRRHPHHHHHQRHHGIQRRRRLYIHHRTNRRRNHRQVLRHHVGNSATHSNVTCTDAKQITLLCLILVFLVPASIMITFGAIQGITTLTALGSIFAVTSFFAACFTCLCRRNQQTYNVQQTIQPSHAHSSISSIPSGLEQSSTAPSRASPSPEMEYTASISNSDENRDHQPHSNQYEAPPSYEDVIKHMYHDTGFGSNEVYGTFRPLGNQNPPQASNSSDSESVLVPMQTSASHGNSSHGNIGVLPV